MARTVFITGATSGVGLATAIDLASRGFRVVGTARSNEKAESLFKLRATPALRLRSSSSTSPTSGGAQAWC